jgi:hypothetical protein
MVSVVKRDKIFWPAVYPLVATLLGGCVEPQAEPNAEHIADYNPTEFENEVAALRQHLPVEMVVMDRWVKEPWKLGGAASRWNVDISEYILPPATVENWTERLTMRVDWRTSKVYFYEAGATFAVVPDPDVIMDATKTSAQMRCENPLTFRKLDEDRTGPYPSVMFYIACDKYPGVDPAASTEEADVYRVFQGRYGLHRVIRARRAAGLDDATIEDWTRYMKRFYLCDDSVPGQGCGKRRP